MNFKTFENNVQNYTGAVKNKFLVINGVSVALNDKIIDNQNDISILRSDLIDVSNRLSENYVNLQNSDNEIIADISTLRNYVDEKFLSEAGNNDAEFNKINSSISSLDSSISDLRDEISSLDSSLRQEIADNELVLLTALDSKTDTISSRVSSLDSSIQTLINADSEKDSSISEIKQVIGNKDDSSTLQTIYGLINKLQAMIEDNEQVMAQALVDLDERIIKLKQEI